MTGPPPDDRLATALERVASSHRPAATPARAIASVRERARHRRRVRRTTSLGAGAAVLVAMAASVVMAWPNGADRSEVRTDQPTTVTGPVVTTTTQPEAPPGTGQQAEPLPPGFRELPPPPLTRRALTATAWTGDELIVWGGGLDAIGGPGGQFFDDGAAFDPATQTWRRLAPAPLDGSREPQAAWTGSEVVVVADGRSAAWDPATNGWRELDGPGRVEVEHLVAADDRVIAIDSYSILEDGADSWNAMTEPPIQLSQSVGAWTGEELLVVGTVGLPGELVGMAYSPDTDRWRELPPSGVDMIAVGATWTGDQLIVVSSDTAVMSYQPDVDRWIDLPDLPLRPREGFPLAFALADLVVVELGAQLAVFDGDGWKGHAIPPRFIPAEAGSSSIFVLATSEPREDLAGIRLVEFAPPTG